MLTLYGLGTIIGAGIYVLVGEIAGHAGMYAPLAFILAAAVATFTGFTYGELAARLPFSAGEAVYANAAFHRKWLSALTGWAVVLTGVVSAAALVNGFTGYLLVLVDVPEWCAVVALTIVLGGILIFSGSGGITKLHLSMGLFFSILHSLVTSNCCQ